MAATKGVPRFLRRAVFGAILAVQSTRVYRQLASRLCPPYQIEEARPEDLTIIQNWWNPNADAWPNASRAGVTDYVARSGATLLGFGQVIFHDDPGAPYNGWWLYSLYVRLRYRGMGIGAALTRRRIEHVVQHGGRQVSLTVREGNRPEIELCRRMGFHESPAQDMLPAPRAQPARATTRYITMTKEL